MFSEAIAPKLTPPCHWDCVSKFLAGSEPLEVFPEIKAIQNNINEVLEQGYIHSHLPYSLQTVLLCGEIWWQPLLPASECCHNQVLIPSPSICLSSQSDNNLIWIREVVSSSWPQVINIWSYGLINYPSVFQAFVNKILRYPVWILFHKMDHH